MGLEQLLPLLRARMPVDTPGVLAISVTRQGRNYIFTFSIGDTDGIRSVTAASLTASDGTNSNVLSDFSRRNANTFAGTDSRRNARWASGSISLTYVDATSGASHTLTNTWTT